MLCGGLHACEVIGSDVALLDCMLGERMCASCSPAGMQLAIAVHYCLQCRRSELAASADIKVLQPGEVLS